MAFFSLKNCFEITYYDKIDYMGKCIQMEDVWTF